jgi:hypothetical protein
MATKKGVGITSQPPKANKKAQYTRQERQDFKSGKVADPRANKQPKYQGLNDQQAGVINNVNRADLGLSDYNLGQLGGVYDAYSQPFDQSQLPVSPWEQGQTIEDMNTEYYDKALANYDRSMADQQKQEDADLDKWAYETGNYAGSPAYMAKAKILQDSRSSAKQNAMDSAYFNAGQNATTWNNLGTQNFQNAYGFQQDMRNMPASEFAKIQGLQSGFGGQNLGYTQAQGLAGQQNKYSLQQIKAGQAGGGGGGGGGSQPMWAQYGFSSPAEYDAYRVQQQRDQSQWEWSNNPQYQQPQQASPWASAAGQIGGIAAGSWLGSLWS